MIRKDRRRKGPIPDDHPLGGGKTIVFSVGPPRKKNPQKRTTTDEEMAMIRAGLSWDGTGNYQDYMRAKQKEYYKSLKGENDNEPEDGEINREDQIAGAGSSKPEGEGGDTE